LFGFFIDLLLDVAHPYNAGASRPFRLQLAHCNRRQLAWVECDLPGQFFSAAERAAGNKFAAGTLLLWPAATPLPPPRVWPANPRRSR